MSTQDFRQTRTEEDLSPAVDGNYTNALDNQRRLAWILCVGIIVAVFFEITGRALYDSFNTPYIITGSMTLAALVTWGGISIYVMTHLKSSHFVKRLVGSGATILILSQICSLATLFPILKSVLEYSPLLHFFLEEGLFLLGIAALFSGFYASLFETHRAQILTEQRRQLLAAEVEERKKAQEKLNESEHILRTLIAVNPESLLLVDANGKVLVANDTAAQRFNTTLEDITGRDILSCSPSELTVFTRMQFERAAGTGTVHRFEVERSGNYFDCCVCPVLDAKDRVQRYALMEIDITKRKQMETMLRSLNHTLEQRVQERTQELQQTNQRLLEAVNLNQELITVSPMGILAFKGSGPCVAANIAASRILELSPEELLNTNFRDSDHLRSIGLRDPLEDVLTEETHRQGGLHGTGTSGTDLHIEYYLSVFAIEGEKHILLILNDVTEQVHTRNIIEEQRRDIENASRMSELGMLSSGIAHEIKTPLAVISVGTQQLKMLLQEPIRENVSINKNLDIILRNVQRMTDIIKSLQNLSRGSGQDPFSRVPATRVVGDAVDLCRYRFLKSGTPLQVSGVKDIHLECRPTQISQVLINLLNNAHDAVESLQEKWVHVEVKEEGDMVVISVTDSGNNLDADIMEKLFQPFFTTKTNGKGIGIGLNISKRIIDSHNGHFEIDGTSPNTRFIVRLPKSQSLTK